MDVGVYSSRFVPKEKDFRLWSPDLLSVVRGCHSRDSLTFLVSECLTAGRHGREIVSSDITDPSPGSMPLVSHQLLSILVL